MTLICLHFPKSVFDVMVADCYFRVYFTHCRRR